MLVGPPGHHTSPCGPGGSARLRAPGSRAMGDPCGAKATQQGKPSRGPEWPGGRLEDIDVPRCGTWPARWSRRWRGPRQGATRGGRPSRVQCWPRGLCRGRPAEERPAGQSAESGPRAEWADTSRVMDGEGALAERGRTREAWRVPRDPSVSRPGCLGRSVTPASVLQGEPPSLDTLRRLIQEELEKQLESE